MARAWSSSDGTHHCTGGPETIRIVPVPTTQTHDRGRRSPRTATVTTGATGRYADEHYQRPHAPHDGQRDQKSNHRQPDPRRDPEHHARMPPPRLGHGPIRGVEEKSTTPVSAIDTWFCVLQRYDDVERGSTPFGAARCFLPETSDEGQYINTRHRA
jgi:hypothetical protein